MEKEALSAGDRNVKSGEGKISFKHELADVWVIREEEIGMHEDYVHCRTHLGKLLNVGDEVLGYDLKTMNPNSDALDQMDGNHTDAVLVRKVYDSKKRKQKRKWILKRVIEHKNDDDEDMQEFQERYIEEDPELRQYMNIYRDPNARLDSDAGSTTGDIPNIDLSEMLEMVDLNKMD